jgi:hypothetical protein
MKEIVGAELSEYGPEARGIGPVQEEFLPESFGLLKLFFFLDRR